MHLLNIKPVFTCILTMFIVSSELTANTLIPKAKDNVVLATKRINIEGHPSAYNPSIIKEGEDYLLLFRDHPDRDKAPFISNIGILRLNSFLEPISSPQLIITRKPGDPTPQQSEDARLFHLNNELYIVYNDNVDIVNPSMWDHRDMFIAKLNQINGRFSVSSPLKLIHSEEYGENLWQKNWTPFDWNGTLLITYFTDPHDVLCPDMNTGICYPAFKTKADIKWHWGKLRGGAPSAIVDGQYLSFFHSPALTISETTQGRELMHYFMGACTFSAEPPFQMTGISPYPIVADGFYTASPLGIRCVYPGGFVVEGSYIYLVYGKDDHEVWIAILDKEKLFETLVPVTSSVPTEKAEGQSKDLRR